MAIGGGFKMAISGERCCNFFDLTWDCRYDGRNRTTVVTNTGPAGAFDDSFNVPSDDGSTPNVYVQLSGVGALPVQVTPEGSLSMGGVVIGETLNQSVTLSNGSSAAVTITQASISGADADEFSHSNGCSILAPGAECQISVTFSPVAVGAKTALLSITTDNAGQAVIDLPVSGEGLDIPVPNIGIAGTSVGFGDVLLGGSTDNAVRLINGGGADLSIASMNIVGPDAEEFSVTRNCALLTSNQQCAETITFTPASAGAKSATLVIVSNDPDTPSADVKLSGFGRDSWNRVDLTTPGGVATLLAPLGTFLLDVANIDNPSVDGLPTDVSFDQGFYEFAMRLPTGALSGAVAISLSSGVVPTTYYKYGPTPDNATPHWYEFMWDGRTGAVIQGNVVTLYFVDGERGDSDLAINGLIVDPGAPGVSTAPSSADGSISSGGGGCSISGQAVLPRAVFFDWALLLLFIGLLPLRTRLLLVV